MKLPKLTRKKRVIKIHNTKIVDYYSWIHQEDILSVLSDPSKLHKEVKEYLQKENTYTEKFFKDTKKLQNKLFTEIKSKIKLSDQSVQYKDRRYSYLTKTTES